MKNFGEKEAWAYPRTAQIFLGTPYYLRNRKSYGYQIWPVYSEGPSEKNPSKNFGGKGAWAYPGTAQFFRVPPIISGTGKAAEFKFGEPLKNFREKGAWAYPGTAHFSGTHDCLRIG